MIILPSAKRMNLEVRKVSEMNPKINLPYDLSLCLSDTVFSNDYYLAHELYDGTIMREFKNLITDQSILEISNKEVKFISPQYGIIDFKQIIKPYHLTYQDKVNGKTVISIWRDYYKNINLPNEPIIDLSTRQTAPFFENNNTVRFELTKEGLKINHGKKLKAKILYHILDNIKNKRDKLYNIERSFEGLISLKYYS